MAQRWRSRKESEKVNEEYVFELGDVFERMVKGMRNEMSTVLWKIERTRDLSPEAIRNILKNGLESMVGAVEKVMNGVSNGMAKEWRARDKEEKENEERARRLEGRREREVRDREESDKRREERLKVLEDRIVDKVLGEKVRMLGGKIEKERKDREEDTKVLKEKIRKIEKRLEEEVQRTEKEGLERQKIIDRVEADVIRDRRERQEYERKREDFEDQQVTMESRKEMERKMKAAIEQIKILNLDFGRECSDRKTLVEEATRMVKEKVRAADKEEFGRIMSGTRISVLGNGTSIKEVEKVKIHTVPFLLTCMCRSEKERLESMVRKAGISTSFQWQLLPDRRGGRPESSLSLRSHGGGTPPPPGSGEGDVTTPYSRRKAGTTGTSLLRGSGGF
jgi:hypothetical protein